jgi:tetratricopeptide (TPR) repeat protein
VGAIEPELDRAEIERARRKPPGNIDAVTELYRGLPHISWPTTPENNDIALQHFRNAMALDPTFSQSYGAAALCLMWRRANYWPTDVSSDDAELSRFADCVKKLGTDDAPTLVGLGWALFHNRVDCEAAIEMVERAIRSNPSYGQAFNTRGWLRACDGVSDAAIADFEQAMRFSPRDPFTFATMTGLALGHFNANRYAEAADWADRSIQAFPYFIPGLATAVACHVEAGRMGDAQKVKAQLLRIAPNWRLLPGGSTPIRSIDMIAKMREAGRKAGMPE